MKQALTFCAVILMAMHSFAQLWTVTPEFDPPRNTQTLTLLDDGRVLQIGGDEGFNVFSNAVEIYDPASDSWTPVNPVPYNVEAHKAFLISENQVVIIGGIIDGSSADSVYVYDVTEDAWSPMNPMPKPLSSVTSVQLEDGRIFVTGGWQFETATINGDAFIFDPIQDTWTTVTPMPEGLVNSTCQLLEGNRIWVCAGLNSGFSSTGLAWFYDVDADTWTSTTSLPYAQSGGIVSTKLSDGNILTVGGFDVSSFSYHDEVLIFDVVEETWTEFATLDNTVSNSMLVTLPDSTLLLAGGNGSAVKNAADYQDVEKTAAYYKGLFPGSEKDSYASAFSINVTANVMDQLEDLPRATTSAPAVVMLNEDVLISGGSGEVMATDTYSDALVYNNPNPTVGVDEVPEESLLNFTPNPSNGLFTITGYDGKAQDIEIYDTSGQLIFTARISPEISTIDMRGFPSGLYVVKTANTNNYKKLIIR